ncbi:MAG: hypothetical protein JO368_07470 [Acidimicrobiales bacterium]|nr:hypothetical protein [Acidimicrobiales bacterium]
MIDWLLRELQARSFREGMRGRGAVWFVVGAAVWMVARARREDGVVFRTRLEPGEGLVVTTRGAGSSSAEP